MSNQNQSRLEHSRFPVFLTVFFCLFCLFCFFCFFCCFFFWVSSYLASCEELLLVPENTKNYFKQLPVHCKQIACIAKKIRDCFSSTRTEVFSNHFISLSFFPENFTNRRRRNEQEREDEGTKERKGKKDCTLRRHSFSDPADLLPPLICASLLTETLAQTNLTSCSVFDRVCRADSRPNRFNASFHKYLCLPFLDIVGRKQPLFPSAASFPPLAFIFINLNNITFREAQVTSFTWVIIHRYTFWNKQKKFCKWAPFSH